MENSTAHCLGGGLGRYKGVHGDVALCITKRNTVISTERVDRQNDNIIQTESVDNQMNTTTSTPSTEDLPFQLILKNVRGLTNDDRLQELLEEALLTTFDWDIIMLTETWRTSAREYFTTNDGHLFASAGCDAGRRGVAFLINKHWRSSIKEFGVINERIAFLRLRRKKLRLCLVVAYFPHAGYSDRDVQAMYTSITTLHK